MLTACSDTDDYWSNTGALLTDGSVVTGSSDVTANSATFHGTVTGLENMNAASYATGFKYGYSQDKLTETVMAASAAEFSATLSGLENNTVLYYQAYVTLQGKMTYTGEVKSLITTDATATTGEATDIDFAGATLAGSISKYPDNATAGIIISTTNDEEAVRAGLRIANADLEDNYAIAKAGLLPGTTYYYAAYLDLGPGTVFGEMKEFATAANEINVDEEFVDLGLSVKWAKRNVGARTETEFGGLFGFGDVTGTNPSIDPADYASADTYHTANDIANVALGGKATLPTADQFEELFRSCKTEWIESDGVAGYLVTGTTGNTIFLPAAGKRIANTISNEGEQGFYLTGTAANAKDSKFAVDYEFNGTTNARSTRAVYEALAVRPVSSAKNVKFDKTLLYNTWHIDLRADESHARFEGPQWYYGTDDSWRTVTNEEPVVGDVWSWKASWSDVKANMPKARDFGSMTLDEEGNVTIVRIDAEGNETKEEGTYTIDETNMTISLSIDILGIPEVMAKSKDCKTNLKILSLTEETTQIAILRDQELSGEGPCLLAFNYAIDKIYSGVGVSLMTVGGDWNGNWGTTLGMIMPEDLVGQHTFKYEGAANGAMVTLLDLVGIARPLPNAFVRIDEIKLDGTPIKFNANNFCYGDIENKGNFRVEMFNIWGKGAKDGNVMASPFSNLTNVGSDPAFTFANSCEITFTIIDGSPEGTYKPNIVSVGAGWWPQNWGFNDGSSFDVTLNTETAKYEMSKNNFDITYTSGDSFAGGTIMTFVQIDNLYKWFPTMHCTLNSCKLDGTSATFDAKKVVDTSDGDAYRLELWNCYGATGGNSKDECGFGKRDGDVIHELGFSTSMELDFTINSLFAVPEF